MISAAAYDLHVEQLFEKVKRLHAALDAAGIPYCIVGGVAVFLQVEERSSGKGRMTRDVDVAVDRRQLARIVAAAEKHGFKYRHAAGLDMLVDPAKPRASTAIHLLFMGEKVRPDDLEPVPGFSKPTRTAEGIPIAPVADLVRMKLTSFRLRDKVHIQDMDSVGLITPEIEASLSEPLRARLAEVRAEK
jgi:hypothetical protein